MEKNASARSSVGSAVNCPAEGSQVALPTLIWRICTIVWLKKIGDLEVALYFSQSGGSNGFEPWPEDKCLKRPCIKPEWHRETLSMIIGVIWSHRAFILLMLSRE